MNKLPTISHLQFLVLDILVTTTELSAQELQTALTAAGQSQHGPKFYQLMKRLHLAGYVEIQHQDIAVVDSDIRRTFYQRTDSGQDAWRLTLEFYQTRLYHRRSRIAGLLQSSFQWVGCNRVRLDQVTKGALATKPLRRCRMTEAGLANMVKW